MGEVAHRNVQGVHILDLSGEYSSDEDAELIESAVAEAISGKPGGIILNYGQVTRMTSGNYGVFFKSAIAAYKQAKDRGLAIKLLIPDGSEVHYLIEHLQITRLDTLLELHTDETDAVNSFCPS
jgi:hypothetical protein